MHQPQFARRFSRAKPKLKLFSILVDRLFYLLGNIYPDGYEYTDCYENICWISFSKIQKSFLRVPVCNNLGNVHF